MLINCYVQDFINHMELERNMSPGTTKMYRSDLKLFFEYLDEKRDFRPTDPIENITSRHIRDYLIYLNQEKKNCPKTIARKLTTLKSFYAFLEQDEDWNITYNPTKNIKPVKYSCPLPRYMTLEQATLFLNHVNETSKSNARDFAIFQTFLQCGLRLSELTNLTINEISFENNQVKVLGKGSRERIIPITPTTVDALKAYIEIRKPKITTDFLFLNCKGKPLSTRGVQYIFEELLISSGLPDLKLSPHKLRHSCLTMLHRQGTDLVTLQRIAGHASIATTQIYLHVVQKDLEIHMAKHPLA